MDERSEAMRICKSHRTMKKRGMGRSVFLSWFCSVWVSSQLIAGVVGFDELSRKRMDGAGYEEIVGRMRYEVDPGSVRNAVIADIAQAPRNAGGRVEFSSDVRILVPTDRSSIHGAAWFEVPNRGGKSEIPRGFQGLGFVFIQIGWEFDVVHDEGKLGLTAPRACDKDGKPIRGTVRAVFTPDKAQETHELTDLKEYPPIADGGGSARLVVRDRVAFPSGSEVPRGDWAIEGRKVRLKGGWVAGRTYEVFYESEGPVVGGLGYAAVRDAVSWFRRSENAPVRVAHAYAFGSSQCGRFLRDFVYSGFNTDESDGRVFDGLIAHIAGAGRLVLNRRWSTPRSLAGYETASYPFADAALRDRSTGLAEGITENVRVVHVPRIFYTNTGAEYWGGGRVAALTHTDPDGVQDVAIPAHVRSYFFSGTAHGPASFPPSQQGRGGLRGNPVNAGPAVLALRHAMHRWVVEGVEPPASVHPSFRDGTLIAVEKVEFPRVPGIASPRGLTGGLREVNPLCEGGAGGGLPLPLLVPVVDRDGHDLGGIRMPEVAVPLGTAVGWVYRSEEQGSPHELYPLRGALVPFALTKAEREAVGDARLSLEERYSGRADYLDKITSEAKSLVGRGFLHESDVALQVRLAGERWDWVMRRGVGSGDR